MSTDIGMTVHNHGTNDDCDDDVVVDVDNETTKKNNDMSCSPPSLFLVSLGRALSIQQRTSSRSACCWVGCRCDWRFAFFGICTKYHPFAGQFEQFKSFMR